MAAEHLLDVYSFIRILLATGTTSTSTRRYHFSLRLSHYSCYRFIYAAKSDSLWRSDASGFLYALAIFISSSFMQDSIGTGRHSFFSTVSISAQYQSRGLGLFPSAILFFA